MIFFGFFGVQHANRGWTKYDINKDTIVSTTAVCFDIVLYGEDLPPIGSIFLESTLPPIVRTRSTRKFATVRPKPPLPK